MTLGFAFWASFPLLVGAILSLAQELRVFETVSDSRNWSFWLDFPQFVSMLVIAKWVYWTYFQNGAAKMARHPGLIDYEWVAKFWASVAAAGSVMILVHRLV